MGRFKGISFGMATSVTFGLIPLFTLPLMGKGMTYDSILFYRFLFASGSLQLPPDPASYCNLVLLAVLPTVVSNITLVLAVQNIGGTLTSVLGALEPLTAVCIGVLVFGENFTLREGAGIVLILAAVTIIVLTGIIQGTLDKVFRKIRPRHA